MREPSAQRAKHLFQEAVELPRAERTRFVQQACAQDQALRDDVLSLLTAAGEEEDAEPLATEQPGDRIGHYKLLKQIGEGGFGVVWMAEQEEPVRREVALKVLKAGMDTAQVVGRFEAERQALALMDHPSIAKVFDGGATSTGRPYFVMELVKGVPITQFCDDAGLGMAQRLDLFVPVCQAVQHAHQKGVIHRDIKPSNVLVTLHDGAPVPKVIDFGIAKATAGSLTQKTVFTEFRQMLGTPEYMAPEQAELSSLDVDTRADIYSLGVLLYELLTGTRPFELKTLLAAGYAEMLRTIKEVDPPKPSTRISTLGEQVVDIARHRRVHPRSFGALMRGDLDWIVMKALEKERSRRYETATALAEDVLRHLRYEPVLASPPSRSYRLRKYARRHRVGVAATAAIVVSLLAGAIVSTFAYLEAKEQSARATASADEARTERNVAQAARTEETRQKEMALQAKQEAETQQRLAEQSALVARTQATKARKVTELVEQMLASSNPYEVKGAGYTVQQLLEDFDQPLASQLAGEPEVESALRRTIGRSFLGLGLGAKAEPHFVRALELCQKVGPADDQQIAGLQLDLAEVALVRGRAVQARQRAEQWLAAQRGTAMFDSAAGDRALRLLADALGDLAQVDEVQRVLTELRRRHVEGDQADDRHWACLLDRQSAMLREVGRLDEALLRQREALAVAGTCLSVEHPTVLTLGHNLGVLLQAAHRLEEARELYVDVLARRLAVLGERHPSTSATLAALALAERQLGDFAAGRQHLQQALQAEWGQLEPSDPRTAFSMREQARMLHDFGELQAAEDLYRRALASYRLAYPDDHPEVAWTKNGLGALLADRACYVEAEALLREAVAARSRFYGADHAMVAHSEGDLGALLRTLARFDEAEARLRNAVRILSLHEGQGGDDGLAVALNNLGVFLRGRGELAEAGLMHERALAIRRRLFSADHPEVANSLMNLGLVRGDEGDLPQAEALTRQALHCLLETLGEDHLPVATLWNNLAFLANGQQHHDEAIEYHHKALALRERSLGPDHPDVASSCLGLATTWLDFKREPAAAEPYVSRALAITLAKLGPDHGLTTTTRALLQRVMATLGRFAEAEEQARELWQSSERTQPPGHSVRTARLRGLVVFVLRQKKAVEAEPLARQLVAESTAGKGPASDLGQAESLLGGCLLLQGHFAEAEPLLRAAIERLPSTGATLPAHRVAVERLAELYVRWGKPEAAAEWRARLQTLPDR